MSGDQKFTPVGYGAQSVTGPAGRRSITRHPLHHHRHPDRRSTRAGFGSRRIHGGEWRRLLRRRRRAELAPAARSLGFRQSAAVV